MKHTIRIALAIIAVAIAACSSSTPVKPIAKDGKAYAPAGK
jgi:uncharacterized lipoprotein